MPTVEFGGKGQFLYSSLFVKSFSNPEFPAILLFHQGNKNTVHNHHNNSSKYSERGPVSKHFTLVVFVIPIQNSDFHLLPLAG